MAHTYVITSAVNSGNDICTITGTVDGFSVTITPWFSAVTRFGSTLQLQNFLAPLMLAAAIADPKSGLAPVPATVPAVTAAGTFSQ
jgi:hypothetical protein